MPFTYGRRKSSRDLLANGLQIPVLAPMISLHASGTARLVFQSDPTSFRGVLITDDTQETLDIRAEISKSIGENKTLVDVSVADGETGQLYILRRIQLCRQDDDGHVDGDVSETTIVDGLAAAAAASPPCYRLKSDILEYSTDEVLVGNRADKEIREYLSPDLVGQRWNLHVGKMNINFSTAIAPPVTPSLADAQRRQHHVSVCGDPVQTPELTDAEINFLM